MIKQNNAGLSPNQRKTLRVMQELIDETGCPPTVDELTNRVKLRKATVYGCLKKLIEKGYLHKKPGKARGLDIMHAPRSKITEVVGILIETRTIATDALVKTEESHGGQVLVDRSLVGNSICCAFSVVGDGMLEADICNGDLVIVRQQRLADSGDIIVVCVDGNWIVKRLNIGEDGRIRLLSENAKSDSIEVDLDTNLQIVGKVVAICHPTSNSPNENLSHGISHPESCTTGSLLSVGLHGPLDERRSCTQRFPEKTVADRDENKSHAIKNTVTKGVMTA
jgi:repressor LexA